MTNPFFGGMATPEPEGPREIDSEERIILKCKVCGEDISRSDWMVGNPWVHVDERIILHVEAAIDDGYNHAALPDIIDTGGKE